MKKIEEEIQKIRNKRMKGIIKYLESAIIKATRKNCWYDCWKRKGNLADYGVLKTPMEIFIKEANVDEILQMVEFLMEKAMRQIENSHDEGDCESQARYWVHKLIKAAVKKDTSHITLINWAITIEIKDIYELTSATKIIIEKNNVPSENTWNEIAEYYKTNKKRKIYLIALKKAGKTVQLKKTLTATAKKTRNYVSLAKQALSNGYLNKAKEICQLGLADTKTTQEKKDDLADIQAQIEAGEGFYENELVLRLAEFEEEISMSTYYNLMELAVAMNRRDEIHNKAIKLLEEKSKWKTLIDIATSEYRLLDAIKYYWLNNNNDNTYYTNGYSCDYDLKLAKKISRIYPEEAIKILNITLHKSINTYTPLYEHSSIALKKLKKLYHIVGKPKEWDALLEELHTKYPKRRNLKEIIENIDNDFYDEE